MHEPALASAGASDLSAIGTPAVAGSMPRAGRPQGDATRPQRGAACEHHLCRYCHIRMYSLQNRIDLTEPQSHGDA